MIYILMRHVPHEFGEVVDVYATRELAQEELDRLARPDLEIEEHEVKSA